MASRWVAAVVCLVILWVPARDAFIESAAYIVWETQMHGTFPGAVSAVYGWLLQEGYDAACISCSPDLELAASVAVVIALFEESTCPYLYALRNSSAAVIALEANTARALGMTDSIATITVSPSTPYFYTGFVARNMQLPNQFSSAVLIFHCDVGHVNASLMQVGLRKDFESVPIKQDTLIGVYPPGATMADGSTAVAQRVFIALESYSEGSTTDLFTRAARLAVSYAVYRPILTQTRTVLLNSYVTYNAAPVSLLIGQPTSYTSPLLTMTFTYTILDQNGVDISSIGRPFNNQTFNGFPSDFRFGVHSPGRCGIISVQILCYIGSDYAMMPATCAPSAPVSFSLGDVPAVPSLVSAAVSGAQVTVQAYIPASSCTNTQVTSYQVHYRVQPNGVWVIYVPSSVTSNAINSAVIRLAPGSSYDIYITAHNVLGSSLASPVVNATLPPGCPAFAGFISSCGFPAPADTTCSISCRTGFYGDATTGYCQLNAAWSPGTVTPTCAACDASCLTCDGPSVSECLSCPGSRFLAGGYCPTCSTNCASCTGQTSADCVVCNDGYYLELGVGCTACNSNCLTCNNTAIQCTSCGGGAVLDSAGGNQTCRGCKAPCASCEFSRTNCLSCLPRYYQDGFVCMACPVNCSSCSQGELCDVCDEDLFLVDGACLGCDATCASCEGPGAAQCTSCGPGLFLVEGACQACPAGGCASDALPAPAPPIFGDLTLPIIGGVAGALILFSLVIAVCLVRRTRKKRREEREAEEATVIANKRGSINSTGNTTARMPESKIDNPVWGVDLDATNVLSKSELNEAEGMNSNSQVFGSGSSTTTTERVKSTSHLHTTILKSNTSTNRAQSVMFQIEQGAVKEIPWSDLKILATLGVGSVATVYQVRQESTYTDMVVKVYNKLSEVEQVARLSSRAKEWSGVHHTHCVPCFGLTSDPESGCIGLLTKHMPRGALGVLASAMTVKDKLSALRDSCRGLAYIHGCKLVHGSLSPNKILIDAYGTAAIGDLANIGAPNAAYAAPEVLAGEPATAASDLYAFALTALHVLSLNDPSAIRSAPAPLTIKGVSGKSVHALMGCLATDPAKRGVIGALAEALIGDA